MIEVVDSDIGIPFFISNVENHELVKKQVLNDIEKMGIFGSINECNSLYNTDWYLPERYIRTYLPTVIPILQKHNQGLEETFSTGVVTIKNIWFQQYRLGDYHRWHVHPDSMFSNVYYVDLSNNSPKTSFRVLNQLFEIQVEEGMIVTFPSFVQHCSKQNQSNNIKTVISFNSNYEMNSLYEQ